MQPIKNILAPLFDIFTTISNIINIFCHLSSKYSSFLFGSKNIVYTFAEEEARLKVGIQRKKNSSLYIWSNLHHSVIG